MNNSQRLQVLGYIRMLWNGLQSNPPANLHYWQLRLYWLIGSYLVIYEKDAPNSWQRAEELWSILPRSPWEEKLSTFYRFYLAFPDWAVITSSISWTHYLVLAGIRDPSMRYFYLQESCLNQWSVRELQRQIRSQFFQRLIDPIELNYMQGADLSVIPSPKGFLKHRYSFEFLEKEGHNPMDERQLESSLMQHLPTFILELGRGFAFIGRQQRISTQTGKAFYIDLSFYHHLLRCFILFELKARPLNHTDIGQLEWYTRLYDHKYKGAQNEPTLGVLLCPKTDGNWYDDTWLKGKPQLFVATYRTDLPAKSTVDHAVDWEWLDQVIATPTILPLSH